MLRKLRVRGFKSLADVTVEFPRLSVLFGPNSAGKSNLLEAIHALSRIGTRSSLAGALKDDSIRGHPFEAFALPPGGIPELASTRTARARESDEIGMIGVRRDGSRTEVRPLDLGGPLFNDPEVADALRGRADHLFESLILSGFIDE